MTQPTATKAAAQVVSPFTVEVQDVSLPPLQPHEALIQIDAAGVCGTDLKIYDGSLPYLQLGTATYPIIPGHEWSGQVLAVGSARDAQLVGQRVVGECHQGCGHCAYCQMGRYQICPDRIAMGIQKRDGGFATQAITDLRTLHAIPDHLSAEEAALIEPTTVAVHALDHVRTMLGKRVALLGCGAIGLLTVQVVRAMGATHVVAVDSREDLVQLAQQLGADEGLTVANEAVLADLQAHDTPLDFDIVVEVTGDPLLVDVALQIARRMGEVVLISLYGGKPSSINADTIVTRELTVYGTLGSPTVWERTIALVAAGLVKTRPLITHRFPLAESGDALATAYEKSDGAIKTLIIP